MKKSELLNWLHEQYRQWQKLLDHIGTTYMNEPGVSGDWSMKEIVSHLTGWNVRLIAALRAAQRGEPEPPPPWPAHLQSDDEINAWILQSTHGRSVGEVLDQSHLVFQQLLAAVESLPDDVRIERIEPEYYAVWVDDKRFLVGEFFDHYREDHEPDVRAWLVRKGKQPFPKENKTTN